MKRNRGRYSAWHGVAALTALLASGAQAQTVAPAYAGRLALDNVGHVNGSPTQMAWGPDGRLYVMTTDNGVLSYQVSAGTGSLSGERTAVSGITGIGIAFHKGFLYLTSFDGSLVKLSDTNGNGVYGEAGELRVKIATNIPTGDHSVDQLQVRGDTLFVGIGRRTINGRKGDWTSGSLDDYGGKGFWSGGIGKTFGDSALNGTIAWIKDLNTVANADGSANTYTAFSPWQHYIQQDNAPYATTASNKLIVHSAGTRNPFGLCLDRDANLWFTNNFNRTQTLGDGEAGFGINGDQLDSDFSRDVQDQVFKAVEGADYGYWDDNWRGQSPLLSANLNSANRVRAITFDNLFNNGPYVLHDPANPDGLGPSSSADGCGFFYAPGLPAAIADNLFIARYQNSIRENGGLGRTLTYADVVAVQPATGKVHRVASGFQNPLAVLWDGGQALLIADIGNGNVYALRQKVHAISGAVTLEGWIGAAQSVTFTFRPADGAPAFTRVQTLDASGGFRFTDLPAGQYSVRVKADRWLAQTLTVDNSSNAVTGLALTLPGGDGNNDNSVDNLDLGLLAAAYGAATGDADFDAHADFNGDGAVDNLDLALLANNYDRSGDD